MKIKNRVEKTITNSLFVIFSLVLFSINLHAQNNSGMELNSNLNPIAFVINDDYYTSSELVYFARKIENNKEEFLQEVEPEKALEIESWMVDEKVFDFHFSVIENEEPLELENWMKNENYFGVRKIDTLAENEEGLKLESWMIEKGIWK